MSLRKRKIPAKTWHSTREMYLTLQLIHLLVVSAEGWPSEAILREGKLQNYIKTGLKISGNRAMEEIRREIQQWRLCHGLVLPFSQWCCRVEPSGFDPLYNTICKVFLLFQHDSDPKYTANAVKPYLDRNIRNGTNYQSWIGLPKVQT